jgi:hypothetical protein
MPQISLKLLVTPRAIARRAAREDHAGHAGLGQSEMLAVGLGDHVTLLLKFTYPLLSTHSFTPVVNPIFVSRGVVREPTLHSERLLLLMEQLQQTVLHALLEAQLGVRRLFDGGAHHVDDHRLMELTRSIDTRVRLFVDFKRRRR